MGHGPPSSYSPVELKLALNLRFKWKYDLSWYDLTMAKEDFEEKDEVTKHVNNWAIESVKKSVEAVEGLDSDEKDNTYLPLAGQTRARVHMI